MKISDLFRIFKPHRGIGTPRSFIDQSIDLAKERLEGNEHDFFVLMEKLLGELWVELLCLKVHREYYNSYVIYTFSFGKRRHFQVCLINPNTVEFKSPATKPLLLQIDTEKPEAVILVGTFLNFVQSYVPSIHVS